MNIQTMKIAEIREATYNPRKKLKPGDAEYRKIKKSIKKFGLVEPLVWNQRTKTLVGGHQRLQVMRDLGWTEVPVVVVDLPEAEEKALNIALNKITGAWDLQMLRQVLVELDTGEFPIELTGFNEDDIEKMLSRGDNKQGVLEDNFNPEDYLAGKKTTTTKRGDIWVMGNHRLMCGDSTSMEDMIRLMAGKKAELVFTDPPYGVSYAGRGSDIKKKWDGIQGDDKRRDDLAKNLLVPALKLAAWWSADWAAFYIWHASSTRNDFEFAIAAAGLEEKQYIIWVKETFVLGWSDYRWQHEPCFYCQKAGQKAEWYGDRDQSTVWRLMTKHEGQPQAVNLANGIRVSDGQGVELFLTAKAPKNKNIRFIRLAEGATLIIAPPTDGADVWEIQRDAAANYIHPTQKPIALAAQGIQNSTPPGALVLDSFAGSGSTLMAAEQLGRTCYTMELDPSYCDAIVHRWESWTKAKADRIEAEPEPARKPSEPKGKGKGKKSV